MMNDSGDLPDLPSLTLITPHFYTGGVGVVQALLSFITSWAFFATVILTVRSWYRTAEITKAEYVPFRISVRTMGLLCSGVTFLILTSLAADCYDTEPGTTFSNVAYQPGGTSSPELFFCLVQLSVFMIEFFFMLCLLTGAKEKRCTQVPVFIYAAVGVVSLGYCIFALKPFNIKTEESVTLGAVVLDITYLALFHEMSDAIFVSSMWYYVTVRPEGKGQEPWMMRLLVRTLVIVSLIRLPPFILPFLGVPSDSLFRSLWLVTAYVLGGLGYLPFFTYFMCEGVILEVRDKERRINLQTLDFDP